jgi:general secretion pathway protein D
MARAAGMTSAGEPVVAFVPVSGTRKLMTIARDPSLQPLVRSWVEQIDRPSDDPTRQMYLYRVQNFNPEQLVTMIRGYLGSRFAGPADEFDGASNQVRITMSADEDVMLIDARHRDYTDLLALLTRLDIPRQQVQMECLIAEVTLGGSLQWGVEYFLETITGEGILELAGNLTGLGPLFPTGTASFVGGSGFALLKVLEGESHVEVLSTPRFTTRDKEEAEFQVGASVPILKASVDSTTEIDGSSGVRNEVEYRDTGLILRAQPMINETGDVTLKISLEIADAAPNTTSEIDSPQFTKRLIETTVTVRHGQTLLLAGIVNKRLRDRVNKIPVLGNIPGAGILFQNIDKSTERTELILTVTPTVINDPAESTALVEGFAAHLPGVRSALATFDAPLPGVVTFGPGGVEPAQTFESARAEPVAGRPDALAGGAGKQADAPAERRQRRPGRAAPVDRSGALLALRRAVSEESGETEDDAQVEGFIDALLAAARPAEGG